MGSPLLASRIHPYYSKRLLRDYVHNKVHRHKATTTTCLALIDSLQQQLTDNTQNNALKSLPGMWYLRANFFAVQWFTASASTVCTGAIIASCRGPLGTTSLASGDTCLRLTPHGTTSSYLLQPFTAPHLFVGPSTGVPSQIRSRSQKSSI